MVQIDIAGLQENIQTFLKYALDLESSKNE